MLLPLDAVANEAPAPVGPSIAKYRVCMPCLLCFICQADCLTTARWMRRYQQQVEREAEQSGPVHIVTCIKTSLWRDMLAYSFNKQRAQLAAITGTVQEVCIAPCIIIQDPLPP